MSDWARILAGMGAGAAEAGYARASRREEMADTMQFEEWRRQKKEKYESLKAQGASELVEKVYAGEELGPEELAEARGYGLTATDIRKTREAGEAARQSSADKELSREASALKSREEKLQKVATIAAQSSVPDPGALLRRESKLTTPDWDVAVDEAAAAVGIELSDPERAEVVAQATRYFREGANASVSIASNVRESELEFETGKAVERTEELADDETEAAPEEQAPLLQTAPKDTKADIAHRSLRKTLREEVVGPMLTLPSVNKSGGADAASTAFKQGTDEYNALTEAVSAYYFELTGEAKNNVEVVRVIDNLWTVVRDMDNDPAFADDLAILRNPGAPKKEADRAMANISEYLTKKLVSYINPAKAEAPEKAVTVKDILEGRGL